MKPRLVILGLLSTAFLVTAALPAEDLNLPFGIDAPTAVVEVVASPSAAAQESCGFSGQTCQCWCMSDPRQEPEKFGTWCEWRDTIFGDPPETWVESGPHPECVTEEPSEEYCQEHYKADDCFECEPETFPECENGNGGNGGSVAGISTTPSGMAFASAGERITLGDGLIRWRCGGWVSGVVAIRPPLTRIIL